MRMAAVVVVCALSGCGIEPQEHALEGGDEHGGKDAATTASKGEAIVEAYDAKNPVSLRLGGAPTADALGWDLKIARTSISTNGGTSGTGKGAAVATTAASIDATILCPTDGWVADEMVPIAGPPGSGETSANKLLSEWFDYDPATHAVSSKGVVYCVRTADGKYGAIRVGNYAGGKMTLEWRYQPNGGAAL